MGEVGGTSSREESGSDSAATQETFPKMHRDVVEIDDHTSFVLELYIGYIIKVCSVIILQLRLGSQGAKFNEAELPSEPN